MKNKLRFISLIIVFVMLINVLLICFGQNKVHAQSISTDINSIDTSRYPGIQDRIYQLKAKYPNWNFKILYTGLNWNDVIANEYTGHGSSPKNLVQKSDNYQGEWICPICGDRHYDNGSWRCASESAIKYMMDPRASLNESDIFQFEELNNSGYDINVISSMVSGTFLQGQEQTIANVANSNNINAYYLAARLIQEQGKSGSVLTAGNGYNGKYVGYYNAFNIAASGNSTSEIIENALKYASKMGWNSLGASISGGISFLANEYIKKGQNTMYLQKFDVEATDGLYSHQYMQNILAAQTEGATLRNAYMNINSMQSAHTFIIPVYENMPQNVCSRPNSNGTSSVDIDFVRVNVGNSLRLRDAPNGSTTVGWIYKDEIVTRLERATSKVAGTYWDKVQKTNGTIGYAARETYENESSYKLYLVPVINETPPETEKIQIDSKNNVVLVTPDVIVNDIVNVFGNSAKITRNDNSLISNVNELVATGFKVEDRYIIKKGDCNGDGYVDTGDTFNLKKVVLGLSSFSKEIYTKAADVNKDGYIDTGDTFLLKKQILGLANISL